MNLPFLNVMNVINENLSVSIFWKNVVPPCQLQAYCIGHEN